MITVSIIDDDRMLLDGMTAWFSSVPDLALRACARTVDELLGGGGPDAGFGRRSRWHLRHAHRLHRRVAYTPCIQYLSR